MMQRKQHLSTKGIFFSITLLGLISTSSFAVTLCGENNKIPCTAVTTKGSCANGFVKGSQYKRCCTAELAKLKGKCVSKPN